jgi:hypothetical protein
MRVAPTICDVLRDPALFGQRFDPPATWSVWSVVLKSLFALPMTADEAAIYSRHTGRSAPPTSPAREGWLIVGRRGGKSPRRVAASTVAGAEVGMTTVITLISARPRRPRAPRRNLLLERAGASASVRLACRDTVVTPMVLACLRESRAFGRRDAEAQAAKVKKWVYARLIEEARAWVNTILRKGGDR